MSTEELAARTAQLCDKIGLRHEPLGFLYSEDAPAGYQPPAGERACLIAVLSRARRGQTVYFDAETVGCGGGGYYLGFCPARPGVDEFVSAGIPGQMEGEHYKKSPELVRAYREQHPPQPAPARYAVFAPLSRLRAGPVPLVVICFAGPDELAGLVGLANFARAEDAVISPFSSGCGTIVTRPLAEGRSRQPRAVLGLFDPSARGFVDADELCFAAPLALWEEMLSNLEDSFLHTPTWARLRTRIGGLRAE